MQIIGMNIEQYVGQGCKDSDTCSYDYDYFSEDKERHVLYGIQSNGHKIKITLSAYEDQCYCGYCLSDYAEIDIEEVRQMAEDAMNVAEDAMNLAEDALNNN